MQYRDLGRLTRVLQISLVLLATVSLFAAVSSWLELELLRGMLSGATVTDDQLLANDSRQGVAGLIELGAYLFSSIAFLQWTYWGTRNAHALGMRRPDFSPAWAVGWHFVPILNLWKPYQALRDTFRGSHPRYNRWMSAPHPRLLGVWWALWLITAWMDNASFRLFVRNDTPEALLTASSLGIGWALLEIPLVVVLFFLSGTLYAWQTEKYASQVAEGVTPDVQLPRSSPRRTLIIFSILPTTALTLIGLWSISAGSLDEPQGQTDRDATGLSDPDVAQDFATITEFIQSQWSGQDPPLSIEEVRARWTELGNGPFPYDPFDGLDYGYEQDGVGFRLWSSGPDGTPGTTDDLIQEWTLLH